MEKIEFFELVYKGNPTHWDKEGVRSNKALNFVDRLYFYVLGEDISEKLADYLWGCCDEED